MIENKVLLAKEGRNFHRGLSKNYRRGLSMKKKSLIQLLAAFILPFILSNKADEHADIMKSSKDEKY